MFLGDGLRNLADDVSLLMHIENYIVDADNISEILRNFKRFADNFKSDICDVDGLNDLFLCINRRYKWEISIGYDKKKACILTIISLDFVSNQVLHEQLGDLLNGFASADMPE